MDYSRIKAFAFDIDGVMTAGGIICTTEGDLLRIYDAKDSFAVRMAVLNGYHVGIITGGVSNTIVTRFTGCGMDKEDIYLCSRNKVRDFDAFCERHGLQPEEVMYFGDDLPDIAVLEKCGIGVCPNDASDDVLAVADIISPYPGGRGCIRHCFEDVMKSQGRWVFDACNYEKRFKK